MPKLQNISGVRYGRLVVQWPVGRKQEPNGSIRVVWLCLCDCGKLRLVIKTNLSTGHTTSCGCSSVEHGYTDKSEYNAYMAAKQRCTNPKNPMWKWYGGRGIEFRFTSFQEFLDHIGPKPKGLTLDRKDNEGHYEVGNVHWITMAQQSKNKRRSNQFLKQRSISYPAGFPYVWARKSSGMR